MKTAKLSLIFTLLLFKSIAQQLPPQALARQYKVSLFFGLNQPLITKGFNVELNYYTKHFVFDYSLGFNLHFKNNLVSEQAKR